MKVLFIGGTGIISSASSELAVQRGIELHVLNRGQSHNFDAPAGAQQLIGDIRRDSAGVRKLLAGQKFDAVVDWVAFTPDHIEQDIEVFAGMTRQFVFISSASAYQKPPSHYRITEDTPLTNPRWQYSRDKIACEERLMRAFREQGFPTTIIRPSLTYGPSQIPLILGSWQKPWTLIERIQRGEKIIVPGDGTSLWTVTWNGDFAKGLVGILGREQLAGHAFHITSDEVLTWDQIHTETAHALGVEPNIVHIASDWLVAKRPELEGSLLGDKIHSAVFDNSKIKQFVPDFCCTVPWSEGVRRSITWFREDARRRQIDDAHNAMLDALIAAYERM